MCFAAISWTAAAHMIAASASLKRSAQWNSSTISGEGAIGTAIVKPVISVLAFLSWTTFARWTRCAALYLRKGRRRRTIDKPASYRRVPSHKMANLCDLLTRSSDGSSTSMCHLVYSIAISMV